MRDLVLQKIQEEINSGDDEIVEEYGDFETIKLFTDEKLLDVFSFMVGFRG